MTQQEKTALKEHDNKVEVIATLSEFNLEKKQKTDDKGVITNYIAGTIVGKLTDTNSITLRCYSSEFTAAKTKNKVYEHLETLINTWKDRLSIASAGEEAALRFRTYGDFQPTHYRGTSDNQIHEGVAQYRSSFFTELKPEDDRPFKAEVKCDLYVVSVRPESGPDGETGRWIIEGYVVTFNGIEKAKFILPQAMSNGIESYLHTGETAEIYADVVNSAVTKEVVKKMGFGPDRIEKKTEYKNELIVNGILRLNNDADPANAARAIDQDVMVNAINNYKQEIENLKTGAKEESTKKAAPSNNKPLW